VKDGWKGRRGSVSMAVGYVGNRSEELP